MATTNLAVIAALLGVSSHLLYFNKGEHHLYGNLYLKLFLVSVGATAALLGSDLFAEGNIINHDIDHAGWKQALLDSGILHGFYLGGVCASLIA